MILNFVFNQYFDGLSSAFKKQKQKKNSIIIYVHGNESSGFCGCPSGVVSDIISEKLWLFFFKEYLKWKKV